MATARQRRFDTLLRSLGLARSSDLDESRQALETVKGKLRARVARQRAEAAAEREYIEATLTMNARSLADRRANASPSDALWIEASADYAQAKAEWLSGKGIVDGRRRESAGLTWAVPPGRDEEGTLSHRILHRGWLPIADIAPVRPFARGGVMLDVGANIGTTVIPRIVLGDFERAYAAEPNSENYRCLVENILSNHLAGLVIPDRVAMSNTPGSAHLRKTTGMGGHHLLNDPGAHASEVVTIVTMDGWLQRLQVDPLDVRFVKADTQGWDVRVLEGAQDLLSRRRAVWQIEVSPSMLDRAGSRPEDLVAQVRTHFSHVRELGKSAAAPWVPAASIDDVLARMADRRQFGNLLLFNLPV